MRLFLDINNVQEIAEIGDSYMVDGVFVAPVSFKKCKNTQNLITEIGELIDGPIIIPLNSEKVEDILKDAGSMKRASENICIQLPINFENLKLCRQLVDDGFFVNMTLCFSVSQAILAAKMGATFISISVARCDKLGINKITLISDIRKVLDNYPEFQTEIVIYEVEDVLTIYDSSKIGIDAACVSLKTLKNLCFNAFTEQEERSIKDELNKIISSGSNLY